MSGTRRIAGLIALLALAIAVAMLRYTIERSTKGHIVLAWPEPSYAHFRMTALVIGAIVGMALGISGVLLQALLRNPLAEPFILGISSGAGLGVMIALYLA